ncbi:MAG: phosphomannomutase/phosphoglucomutase [Candidatus Jidaibacter sp.]|jgi:phosphomannomutase|nr:phosphomannomutase/phosphoglucomutase [Candidatus Jidaibacter sp.]
MTQLTHIINPEIIRAYDIRGKYGVTLLKEDGYYLGRSIATFIKNHKLPETVCVGRDGRLSSPDLHSTLIQGLVESGMKVTDIGIVATPTLYYTAVTQKITAGIMITGSHNPGDQNGFKIIYQGRSFFGGDLEMLAKISAHGNFAMGNGSVEQIDIRDEYIDALNKRAVGTLGKKMRIAWDPGNGATGELVEKLVKVIDAEHFVINSKIDGNFPNHHPDPTVAKNMEQLCDLVLKNNCDIGFAFDGDGDRLGVVDNKGRIVFGDQTLFILAEDMLTRIPGAKVVADIKTSNFVFSKVAELGGEPIMWKTGHSLIKVKMKEEDALLGGEMSGHLFFGENYYGFDDALFGACKMINILSNKSYVLADKIDDLPKIYATPELRIDIDETIKFEVIELIKGYMMARNIKFSDLDGVRVSKDNGWWLVRASNTQSSLVARVEGNTEKDLQLLCEEAIKIFSIFNINSETIRSFIECR